MTKATAVALAKQNRAAKTRGTKNIAAEIKLNYVPHCEEQYKNS